MLICSAGLGFAGYGKAKEGPTASPLPDFRLSTIGKTEAWRSLRCGRAKPEKTAPVNLNPFATASGNDRYLRGADGRSRRRADIADRRWTSRSSAVQWSPRNGKIPSPRRTSHGQTQASGSGGADLSLSGCSSSAPRISSADNARRDLRRQKTSVQQRSSQTRAPSLQNCASGPPKNPYAMRRYRRRRRCGRTIRT